MKIRLAYDAVVLVGVVGVSKATEELPAAPPVEFTQDCRISAIPFTMVSGAVTVTLLLTVGALCAEPLEMFARFAAFINACGRPAAIVGTPDPTPKVFPLIVVELVTPEFVAVAPM